MAVPRSKRSSVSGAQWETSELPWWASSIHLPWVCRLHSKSLEITNGRERGVTGGTMREENLPYNQSGEEGSLVKARYSHI